VDAVVPGEAIEAVTEATGVIALMPVVEEGESAFWPVT
jgi:hypothetical protein